MASAVSMLEILCEEIHKDTEKNVQTVVTYVNIISLHKTMFICYMLRKVDDIAEDTAIKTHNLLKHMADFKGIEISKCLYVFI